MSSKPITRSRPGDVLLLFAGNLVVLCGVSREPLLSSRDDPSISSLPKRRLRSQIAGLNGMTADSAQSV